MRSTSPRPPRLAGLSYPNDPRQLAAQLDTWFNQASDNLPALSTTWRAALCPHIDFARGGAVYATVHRALNHLNQPSSTYLIYGVSHRVWCRHRFAATRRDFATPLGLVRTDQRFLDHLERVFGPELFVDADAHDPEWSIEFQAVWLQHLLGGRRDFTIVPILVGSFHDLMVRGVDPLEDPLVQRMVEAIVRAERDHDRPVFHLASVDFSHIGPEFGDPEPLRDHDLEQLRQFDRAMLDHLGRLDAHAWFAEAAAIKDRHRVCGLAATYTMTRILTRPDAARVAQARGPAPVYRQAVSLDRDCCVSFAGVLIPDAT